MADHVVYTLPWRPAPVSLSILAALLSSPEGSVLTDRLAVQFSSDGRARLSFRSRHTRLGAKYDSKFEGKLFSAYNGNAYNQKAGSQLPRDLPEPALKPDAAPEILRDMVRLVARAIAAASEQSSPFGEASEAVKAAPVAHLAYVVGPQSSDLSAAAAALAPIEWRSSGMSIGAYSSAKAPGTKDDELIAIAAIGIDPSAGATQDIAAKYPHHFETKIRLFLPYTLGHGLLLLKPGVILDSAILDDAAVVLTVALAEASLPSRSLVAIEWDLQSSGLDQLKAYVAELPEQAIIPTATGSVGDAEYAPLAIDVVALEQRSDATTALRWLLEKNAEDIGHRLELRHVGRFADSNADLDAIERQIEDLSMRRDIILGQEAGGWRLLRFPASAISALIDYLRRFPPHIFDEEFIRYGFRASAEEPRGAHYLLYQLADVGQEPAYPEIYWRELHKAGTIVHRLDPLFAQFAASKSAASLVFTPRQHVVVPNFRATQVDVDAYLKQGFGALFGLEDAFEIAGASHEAKQPIYIFGITEGRKIRVEIMDGAQFQPIGRVVPFLNDNLEIARRIDLEEFITNAADGLWRKERLEHLQTHGQTLAADLDQQIALLDQRLAEESQRLIRTLTQEVDDLRAHIGDLTSMMVELGDRASEIEKIFDDGIRRAGSLETLVEEVPDRFSELVRVRTTIQDAIGKERRSARDFTRMATENLASIRADIKRLRKELDGDHE